MEKIFVLRVTSKEIDKLVSQLKTKVKTILTFDNLFELRKNVDKQLPDAILVADNFKEKKIEDLMRSVRSIDALNGIPIFALISFGDVNNAIAFLTNGASDAVYAPFSMEELLARMSLRIEELQLRQSFTSGEFFFNEVQEKEQGRRTGIFRFFNQENTEVGNVSIKNGRLVHATYGSLIKEDAFLQISSNTDLKFVFNDKDDIVNTPINEGITGLLLEASKLKDEIKKQEKDNLEEFKSLVIDGNRIARIMASRVLKDFGYQCKVTSPAEMTVRFMVNYAPQLIVIDYLDGESMMNMLWPTGRKDDDISVIIYCDEDVKDINSVKIGNHDISAVLYKKQFHKDIKQVLQDFKIL